MVEAEETQPWVWRLSLNKRPIPVSFNGRTEGFDPSHESSILSTGTQCACSLMVEREVYTLLTGVRFLSGALGYSTSMLWTILVILAIIALVLFILGRR
jgi:hypothetical protein